MRRSSQSSSRGRKRGSANTLSARLITNTTTTKTTKSSGPYDPNFQQKLIDNGVYPHSYEYPDGRVPGKPSNWREINQRLRQDRSSLSPTVFPEEKFEEFVRADAHVSKENKATKRVIPIIEGKVGDDKCDEGDVLFTNLDSLTNDTLTSAKPDLYYGARPELLNRHVREELSGYIIPSKQDHLPLVPNFFLAAKGPDGTWAVAGRQACYNGALGARGMHSLQQYGQEKKVYDNNAYTITSIYNGGSLTMYTSHPSEPASPGGCPEYYMTQLRSFAMNDTLDTFRQGAAAFRNARDWAREQRDKAITRANEKVNNKSARILATSSSAVSSFASGASLETYTIEPLSYESQTSLNEHTGNDAFQEPDTATDESNLLSQSPVKRSGKYQKRSHPVPRKRRNAGESSDAECSRASTALSAPQHFSADDAVIQCEEWSWTNSKFQCRKGQMLIKEQSETPADVWVYHEQGWPGQAGKKWRHWISTTREILFS